MAIVVQPPTRWCLKRYTVAGEYLGTHWGPAVSPIATGFTPMGELGHLVVFVNNSYRLWAPGVGFLQTVDNTRLSLNARPNVYAGANYLPLYGKEAAAPYMVCAYADWEFPAGAREELLRERSPLQRGFAIAALRGEALTSHAFVGCVVNRRWDAYSVPDYWLDIWFRDLEAHWDEETYWDEDYQQWVTTRTLVVDAMTQRRYTAADETGQYKSWIDAGILSSSPVDFDVTADCAAVDLLHRPVINGIPRTPEILHLTPSGVDRLARTQTFAVPEIRAIGEREDLFTVQGGTYTAPAIGGIARDDDGLLHYVGHDSTVRVYNPATGALVRSYGTFGNTDNTLFCPYAIRIRDGVVYILDLNGRPIDDDGDPPPPPPPPGPISEQLSAIIDPMGYHLVAYQAAGGIAYVRTLVGGAWSVPVTVVTEGTQPSLSIRFDGALVCAYHTAAGAVALRVSHDHGDTWEDG